MQMVLWMLAGYLAVGLVLVFVGPAARLRRHERFKLGRQAQAQPWKLTAFSICLALGIIVLWPVLAASAARTEAASHPGSASPASSAELSRQIAGIQKRYPGSLPYDIYSKLASELDRKDRHHLDRQLVGLGYTITGFARYAGGKGLAVAIPAIGFGGPIDLTKSLGSVDSSQMLVDEHGRKSSSSGLPFRSALQADDQIWQFSSSQDSWAHLAGRGGLALVREGVLIDTYVTVMS
jgi:hypothetical protein